MLYKLKHLSYINYFKNTFLFLFYRKFLLALSGCFTLTILVFTPIYLFAQEQDIRFTHLSKRHGLSQNNVNCILQDSKGFIWIGTNEDLNKYDGYEFTIFEKGSLNGQMLSDDVIQTLFEDSKGRIWVGTQSGGINIFNKTTNKFSYLNLDSILFNVPRNKFIRSIIADIDSTIWFLAGNTIVNITEEEEIIDYYTPKHLENANDYSERITVIYIDSFNNFWFGTPDSGLGLLNRKEKTFSYFPDSQANNFSNKNMDIRSILEDSSRNLWIGTYNSGLHLFDKANKKYTTFLPEPSIRESYTIKTILQDENKLWLGTRSGLYIFDKLSNKFNKYSHDSYNPYSLSQNNVKVIYSDRDKNIWLGTKRGINLIKNVSIKFTHYRTDQNYSKCLNSYFCVEIFEDQNNQIWFGTSEGGLNKLNPKTGNFTYYTHDINNPYSISSNNINSIIGDDDNNLWIGTLHGGINFFDQDKQRFYHYKLKPNKSLINQGNISVLAFDSKKRLWVATEEEIMIFNTESKKFYPLKLFGDNPDFQIIAIAKDVSNYFWLGTNNNTLYKVDPITFYKKKYTLPKANAVRRINKILIVDNNLWIGTSGAGLFCFNKKTEKFKLYTKEDGLSNNYVVGIQEDNNNNLWISSLDGLSKLDLSTKKFVSLHIENGLQNDQFTLGNLKTSEGVLYFGDIDGAISFKPTVLTEEIYNAPVTFTEFRIFNNPVRISKENSVLNKHIGETKNITLSYDQSSFTFAYAAIDYTMSEKINYAYIMDGFDNNWNYVENRRYATYTNLNPGEYTFKVKAANNAGQWSNQIASIDIVISPPYWETWWFRGIIIAIFSVFVWFISNYAIQKRNLLKATAFANITQLKLLRNQMNPHFLLNTFSVIRALVLIDKEKAWEMISKLSDYFRYMLLNYSREKDTLNEEIEAVKNYISIQQVCFHEYLDVDFDIDENAGQLVVPSFMFQPLIENAIKYGSQTSLDNFKIIVKISYNDNNLIIDIGNTGKFVDNQNNNIKDSAHGTSIKNIKKRLNILFKDNFSFKIFEKDGWVHSIIKIEYYTDNFNIQEVRPYY